MAAILKVHNIKSKIRLCQSMRIYVKNIPAKFHPDPIWEEEALSFFKERHPNKNNNNNKMSSDMGSVPDLRNKYYRYDTGSSRSAVAVTTSVQLNVFCDVST